mgnify:CR=1 FL=1
MTVPTMPDLDSRSAIHDLVVRFYREVVFDDLLGPVFGEVAEVDTALRSAGIDPATLPDGARTRVGDLASDVSAGQRRRIALARVMLEPAPLGTAIRDAIAAGFADIVSPFPETHRRTTSASAEARNRHILTLCEFVVIAHASQGGKTEALAREALSFGRTVYAFSSPGNAHLFDFGAIPLDESL